MTTTTWYEPFQRFACHVHVTLCSRSISLAGDMNELTHSPLWPSFVPSELRHSQPLVDMALQPTFNQRLLQSPYRIVAEPIVQLPRRTRKEAEHSSGGGTSNRRGSSSNSSAAATPLTRSRPISAGLNGVSSPPSSTGAIESGAASRAHLSSRKRHSSEDLTQHVSRSLQTTPADVAASARIRPTSAPVD
jgi:hypothetical protein